MEESLKDKTAKGLLWGAVNNGAQQVLSLVFGIVLARLLNPGDYGMVGMLAIFSLIGTALQESGFRAALASLKEAKHEDYNAVFWCSVGIGIAVYIILWFCAPYISIFYGVDELTPLARYSFLSIPLASLGTAQGAYLYRNLQVKQQAAAGIVALVLSGSIGVGMAYCGFSYWGIATQSLTYLAVSTACSWQFSPWRPTLDFDFSPLKQLFTFSSKLLITNIANHLNNNILTVILGKSFDAQAVGNYSQANKWNGMGHQLISGMVGSVSLPVLAKVKGDRQRETRVFRKMLRFTSFTSFPAMIGLASVAEELIVLAVGEKWSGSVPMMRLLCIGGAFVPLNALFSNLIVSQGKSDIYMRNIIAQLLTQLVATLIAALLHGSVYTMIMMYVCVNIIWLFVWQSYAQNFIDFGLGILGKDIFPFLLAGGASCGLGYLMAWVIGGHMALTLIIKVVVAVGCYFGSMWLWDSQIMKESLMYLRKKRIA